MVSDAYITAPKNIPPVFLLSQYRRITDSMWNIINYDETHIPRLFERITYVKFLEAIARYPYIDTYNKSYEISLLNRTRIKIGSEVIDDRTHTFMEYRPYKIQIEHPEDDSIREFSIDLMKYDRTIFKFDSKDGIVEKKLAYNKIFALLFNLMIYPKIMMLDPVNIFFSRYTYRPTVGYLTHWNISTTLMGVVSNKKSWDSAKVQFATIRYIFLGEDINIDNIPRTLKYNRFIPLMFPESFIETLTNLRNNTNKFLIKFFSRFRFKYGLKIQEKEFLEHLSPLIRNAKTAKIDGEKMKIVWKILKNMKSKKKKGLYTNIEPYILRKISPHKKGRGYSTIYIDGSMITENIKFADVTPSIWKNKHYFNIPHWYKLTTGREPLIKAVEPYDYHILWEKRKLRRQSYNKQD